MYTVGRATFSSLKARHQAYRLATDILYSHDLIAITIDCSECEATLRPDWADWFGKIRCPRCGTVNVLPPEVVVWIRRERPELMPVHVPIARRQRDAREEAQERDPQEWARQELTHDLVQKVAIVVAALPVLYFLGVLLWWALTNTPVVR